MGVASSSGRGVRGYGIPVVSRGQYTWMPFFPNGVAVFLNYLHEISFSSKMLS